ncbi:hypothetical protein LSS_11155 [Leptospira santarosai serovar Shermani str. LT 821]|uniref:Uncharacterized protein n=1 Tax=Leptospira santarosai serovar Shermani str. LT 821 TaxID=758847 RepID=K8Y7T6_9LEPT|nr:hypothetical protein LSS_11155 [Leptospira santarosai serovar Shermani str. LT 821]
MNFHLVIGRKTEILYRNLILRLLSLDFIEVP